MKVHEMMMMKVHERAEGSPLLEAAAALAPT